MLITDDIFYAFLQCETKAHLKLTGAVGDQRAFSEWERHLVEDYKQQCYRQWRADYGEAACLVGGAFPHDLDHSQCRFVMDCTVRTQEMQAHLHAVEWVATPDKPHDSPYMPIRCVPREKITTQDKLLLAFDALVLWTISDEAPRFGKIIHGRKQATAKVELAGWLDMAQTVVSKIAAQQASQKQPPLILNQHCAACEFKARCRQVAIEKDELSLLSSMTAKERKQQHSKGIFSVTQLSYTFRARRKPKRFASKPDKYSHALRALALRERKIHIAGKPELKFKGNPVYMDVEGVPDRDFYYLIGLRIKSSDAYVQYSFWANELSEEKESWASFLQTLAKIDNPQLIHYGSYETTFLKRMKERYREAIENPAFLDQLIAESVNVLSVIYAQIYFPTYSNGLKEVAQYLGFQWSESDASGLNTLMWRSQWESSKDSYLKQKLVTYNAEDCEALEVVASTVAQLCQRQSEAANAEDNVVYTDSMKRESLYRFGKNAFSMPEFEYINQAAYWDYQREKIYVRSSKRLKRISRMSTKSRGKALPINKVVECPPPCCCPKCKGTNIHNNHRESRIIPDLKFSRTGVKRWIVKYSYYRYECFQCGATFLPQQKSWNGSKYGSDLRSYIIYQIIELHIPQRLVTQGLNQLFGFNLLGNSIVTGQKIIASQLYKTTYKEILNKIVGGMLIQADETKINIKGKEAFIWVFTNLEEVAYLYTETREGDFLQELLREFRGVLVSDFYAAYDSIT
jgi:predicted RecB family nuclease